MGKSEGKREITSLRSLEIDLYRLLFSIIVVLHHSHGLNPPDFNNYPFVGGYLAVEFFFMLTGYFSARKTGLTNDKESAAYHAAVWTGRKFLRLYTYVVPAVFIHYLVYTWIENLSPFEAIKLFLYGSFEMFLLPESGLYENFLVVPLWYLSSLLLILPLFYFTAIKVKETFFFLICPISIFLIYGYCSVTYGHIDIWSVWTGFFFLSLPRTWAGLCLGGLCYFFSEKLQNARVPSGVLLWVQFLCLGGSLFSMFTRQHKRLDFLCIGLLFIFLTITLSRIKGNIKGNTCFLGEYSLAVYVSHWTIRYGISSVMAESAYQHALVPYLFFSLIYAGMLVVGVRTVRCLSLPQKIRNCFQRK